MRLGVGLLLLGACSLEKTLPPNGTFDNPDAKPMADARPDTPPPPPDAPPPKVCAAAYVALANAGTQSKYRRVQVQTEWLDEKADCASDGGYIAIPETTAEAIAIHTFVNPLLSSPYFWAGILDPEQDGQWVTVNGQAFPAFTWGIGDPDQRTGEIYAIVDENGNYYDWFDYGTQEYACECSP
jgi:hypothetical protein